MVDQSIDHGCCHDVVGEDLTPATKTQMRRDQQAALFIPRGHELEKQVGGGSIKWDVAQLIDLCRYLHNDGWVMMLPKEQNVPDRRT